MKSNKPTILFDIDETLFNTSPFRESNFTQFELYPDVVSALTTLSTLATLGIFSESKYELQEGNLKRTDGTLSPGAYEFQMNKLTKTNIIDFFSAKDVHIVGEKISASSKVLPQYRDRETYFVDDKLPMLQEASKTLPDLHTIWLRRGSFAAEQKPIQDFTPTYTIDSLSEIIPIVKTHLDK